MEILQVTTVSMRMRKKREKSQLKEEKKSEQMKINKTRSYFVGRFACFCVFTEFYWPGKQKCLSHILLTMYLLIYLFIYLVCAEFCAVCG